MQVPALQATSLPSTHIYTYAPIFPAGNSCIISWSPGSSDGCDRPSSSPGGEGPFASNGADAFSGCLRFRRKNHSSARMIANPATPPTTPPAIAPVLVPEPVSSGDEVAVEDVVPVPVLVLVLVPDVVARVEDATVPTPH